MHQFVEYWGLVQDVDVVKRSWTAEVAVPDPETAVNPRLKDYSMLFLFAFVLSSICSWVVLPLHVHAVDRAEHADKSTCCILLKEALHAFLGRRSEVLAPKERNHGLAKVLN